MAASNAQHLMTHDDDAGLGVSPDFYARPRNVEEREEDLVRSIVARQAKGNTRLQSGRYVTKRQVDAEYEQLAEHEF